MEKNRGWVILAILLLVMVLWSAATMHWHYVGALLLAGVGLFLSHLAYSILSKDIPDDATLTKTRDALWWRSIGANFPFWPERDSGMGYNIVEQKPAEAERLVAYVDRALGRQIDKARGILPFNSLIMALMAIEKAKIPASLQWNDSLSDIILIAIFAVIVGLAASSFFCLELFWVHWGAPESYGAYSTEFQNSIAMLRKRSRILAKCIIISVVSTLIAIGIIGFTELIGS
jgi:hypothetical protein